MPPSKEWLKQRVLNFSARPAAIACPPSCSGQISPEATSVPASDEEDGVDEEDLASADGLSDRMSVLAHLEGSVEFLEGDAIGALEAGEFQNRVDNQLLQWLKRQSSSIHLAALKLKPSRSGNSKRSMQRKKREAKLQLWKNAGTTKLTSFFGQEPAKKRQRLDGGNASIPSPTSAPRYFINMDTLGLVEAPLTNTGSTSVASLVSLSDTQREETRLEEDEEDDEEEVEQEEVMLTVQESPSPSPNPSDDVTPTPPTPTTLHPNGFEGEDPVDIQKEIWKDQELIRLVGIELERMVTKHHKVFDKVLLGRVYGMKATISLYTQDSRLTWTAASLLAAKAASGGISMARKLRQFILAFARGNCTYQALPHTSYAVFDTSLLRDEDLSQRIRQHLQTLGQFFCAQDVLAFISSPEMQACMGTRRKMISLATATRWLKDHHRYGYTGKGQYADGHGRADVVAYRIAWLTRMKKYEERMARFDVVNGNVIITPPTLTEGSKLLVLVTHDESTFYENDRKRRHWVPLDEGHKPQPKGEGASLMISDFISPLFGRLVHGESKARVAFKCGKNRDGYFDNDDILKTTTDAIDIFEQTCPGAQGLFIFDNATTHRKRAPDALSALEMPRKRKVWRPDQPRMRNGRLPDGMPQSLYFPDGDFKGMDQILKERGKWLPRLKAQCHPTRFSECKDQINCCIRRILFSESDFQSQPSLLEELVAGRGHICEFYPKFHCELNFIEQYWGAAKFRYRAQPPTKGPEAMEETVKACLDDVPLVQMQRYWIRSQRFMDAYRKGLDGAQAAWATRRYHGHRQLPLRIMDEIEKHFG